MVRRCHLAVVSFALGLLLLVPAGSVHADSRAVVVQGPSQPRWMKDWSVIAEVLCAELVTADMKQGDLERAQADTLRGKWLVDERRGVYYSNSVSVKLDAEGRLDVKYAIVWEGNPTNITYFVKKVNGRYQVVERKVTVLVRSYGKR